MLAIPPADYQYHDSYFVVAHFHYVIVGGLVFGLFAGLHYWWPKMFGKMLNETLGKWNFWTFFLGFHLTFFPQHFLGLMGMPRRVFTYLKDQNLDMGNMISTIGAFGMTIGTILFLVNIFVTAASSKRAPADPWDGRTLEWSIPSPPPEYNFAQTPLVRGLDAFWIEKVAGNKGMTPAEPLGDIHMPSPSFLPFLMSVGLFIAGYGFMYHNYVVVVIGLLVTFACMFTRSVKDDPGYHIHEDEIEDKGVKA
jgi:cytochrome c oxidase subunit 1